MGSFSETECASSGGCSDPIWLALRVEKEAQKFYADALSDLDRAGAFSGDLVTRGEVYWQMYNLEELEAAEAAAGQKLAQAEKWVLETKPTSLEGSVALLSFLRNLLNDYPKLMPVIGAISNVEEALINLSSSDPHSSI